MRYASDSSCVLVTGFEAFGGGERNPTAEIARALDGSIVAGHRVHGVELPVTAAGAPAALREAVERHRPALVLSTGLANGRSMLALERIAINVMDFPMPDNDGDQPADEPIERDGPAAYFTGLPVKATLAAWREEGFPGYVSNTAGTYVCNLTFYHSLHLSERLGYRAGLIHVPYLPEQAARIEGGAPSMPLDLMLRAVELALEVSLQTSEDIALPGAGAIS